MLEITTIFGREERKCKNLARGYHSIPGGTDTADFFIRAGRGYPFLTSKIVENGQISAGKPQIAKIRLYFLQILKLQKIQWSSFFIYASGAEILQVPQF